MQELSAARDGNKWQRQTSELIWKHATIHGACLGRFLFYYELPTPNNFSKSSWFLLSTTCSLIPSFQRCSFRPFMSYLFGFFFSFPFFPPSSSNPDAVYVLLHEQHSFCLGGKQKRFVFISPLTAGSWSTAHAGKLQSQQQADFWRHARSAFATGLKLGAKICMKVLV